MNIFEIKNKILTHFNIKEDWWYNSNFPIELLGCKINSNKENISFEENLIKDYNVVSYFSPHLSYYVELINWIELEFKIEIHDTEAPEFFIDLCRIIYEKINKVSLKFKIEELFPDDLNDIITINSSVSKKELIEKYLKSYLLINDIVWIDDKENTKEFQIYTIPWSDVYKNEKITFYLFSIQYEKVISLFNTITFFTGYFK